MARRFINKFLTKAAQPDHGRDSRPAPPSRDFSLFPSESNARNSGAGTPVWFCQALICRQTDRAANPWLAFSRENSESTAPRCARKVDARRPMGDGFGDRKWAERGWRVALPGNTRRAASGGEGEGGGEGDAGGQGIRDSLDRPLNFPSNFGVHDSCAVVPAYRPTRSSLHSVSRVQRFTPARYGSADVYGRSSRAVSFREPAYPGPYAEPPCVRPPFNSPGRVNSAACSARP